MPTLEFRLPDVGEGTAAADVLEWRVAEGDPVNEHDVLVEVQTDKAAVEIPAPASGTLVRHGAAPGETLEVGAVLAVIETAAAPAADAAPSPTAAAPDAATSAAPSSRPTAAGAAAPDATASPASAVSGAPSSRRPVAGSGAPADPPPRAPAGGDAVTARPLAAPATRRLARELGVDLRQLAGSGPHGRITREDVENARSTPTTAPAADEVVPLRGVRRTIAHALTEAWRTVPHVTDYREVDAGALLATREALRDAARRAGDEELAQALTPTPLLVKIAAAVLAQHPYVNASIDLEREEITLHARCDIGVATATDAGLVVPVVHDAANRSIEEIAREVQRLTALAKANRLRPNDLSGGTFTVNNYGGLGIWLGTPIVRPPEVANLGIGAIRDQVVAVDGHPVVRPTAALAVSADHRVLDGHTLAAFVTDVVRLIEQPALLLGSLR